jgi:fatty-acyl-CoA synthase
MVDRTYPEFSTHYPLLLKSFMQRPVNLYPHEIGMVYRNHISGEYQRFTWLQWYQRTCRLANVLKTLGVNPGKAGEPGDRIGIMALNTHRHMELYYAVPCSGATLHSINVRLAAEHVVYTITHAEDKVLFFDDVLLPMAEAVYERIKDTVKAFVYMSDQPGLPKTVIEPLFAYEELLASADETFAWPYLDEDTPATLCYTTATTGLPKGAMFTHRALYLQTLHLTALLSFSNEPQTDRLGENDVPMITTPFFHIHAWSQPFSYVFRASKIVLPGAFTVEGFCDLVQTERVTHVAVVPTILVLLLEYKDIDRYDLSSLISVGVGGSELPLGLKEKIEKRIPNLRAAAGYGMTETAPVTVTAFIKKYMRDWPKEKLDQIRVKTGLPVPGLEVDVIDGEGVGIAHDDKTIGEIVVRGPWVMEKYYKNPQRTAEVWYDEWFHTGDLATVDAEGYITIVDRMSDVIRSGSEMIPTVLLENLAARADFVLEATVVGVPDPLWGEKAMAVIKVDPGAGKGEHDLIAFLKTEGVDKGKIAKWMLPKLVAIVDEIPKTSVGKFSKRLIRRNIDRFLARAVEI